MSIQSRKTIGRLVAVGPSRVGYLVLALVACSMAAATYAIAAGTKGPSRRAAAPAAAVKHSAAVPKQTVAAGRGQPAARAAAPTGQASTPTAAEFGRGLVGLTAAYGKAHGLPARLVNVDCVQASPGHYMCSYAIVRPGTPPECHVMQAVWTPRSDSSFRITVAGRSSRCGSLREALRSLL
jgi:hypothetical protein